MAQAGERPLEPGGLSGLVEVRDHEGEETFDVVVFNLDRAVHVAFAHGERRVEDDLARQVRRLQHEAGTGRPLAVNLRVAVRQGEAERSLAHDVTQHLVEQYTPHANPLFPGPASRGPSVGGCSRVLSVLPSMT